MAVEARRLEAVDSVFGIQAASHPLTEVIAPWVQDLGVLVEAIEAGRRPAGLAARCGAAAAIFREALPRRRGGLPAGADGAGRHRDGVRLRGGVE